MKRFLVALTLLAAVFALTYWNSGHLRRYTQELDALLTRAEAAANQGSWGTAADLTGQALNHWQQKGSYLHITLRHSDTNQIYVSFREVDRLVRQQQAESYPAANQRLIAYLTLLYEMEQFNWKNIL